MAMYYYASKISAIACGTRCRQTVLQQTRAQRDRDKFYDENRGSECEGVDDEDDADGGSIGGSNSKNSYLEKKKEQLRLLCNDLEAPTTATTQGMVRFRRHHSEQLDAYDIEGLGFRKLQVSAMSGATNSTRTTFTSGSLISSNLDYNIGGNISTKSTSHNTDIVQYAVPKHHRHSELVYETSVLGAGGLMYINDRIVSGPLDSLIKNLLPKTLINVDKEFIFSFLLSSRLFLRPHELLGKLLSSVPECESLEALVALLAEWTNMFPYDYRDERMMSHVKHIVARCSSTCFEAVVSAILSALLNRLTDLDRHEQDLRSCQIHSEKMEGKVLECATSVQYAQLLCRLEKKLAKHIGPEEFLQSSSNVLLDKQKKWDQPSMSCSPPGAQDPKKTCNLETYLDWSVRLRLFVCNEILQCSSIRDRSKIVELWSGVAQYCLLVGNYNSATAILETLESPPLSRLKITWSKLQVTCQQLDCMQRHAEGHGDLWNKQAIVLNENHHHNQNYYQQKQLEHHSNDHHHHNNNRQKPDMPVVALLSTSSSTVTTVTTATTETDTDTGRAPPTTKKTTSPITINLPIEIAGKFVTTETTLITPATLTPTIQPNNKTAKGDITTSKLITGNTTNTTQGYSYKKLINTQSKTNAITNDWVVIPVFADIVKLALSAREECLQSLPNGHINIVAFDRMAAIVGAFTRHMQSVMSATEVPADEYEMFCRHMQKNSKLSETDLMMASFDCEEPNNAEKLMYDLN